VHDRNNVVSCEGRVQFQSKRRTSADWFDDTEWTHSLCAELMLDGRDQRVSLPSETNAYPEEKSGSTQSLLPWWLIRAFAITIASCVLADAFSYLRHRYSTGGGIDSS